MPSDFGDESGERLVDWLELIGQQAGDNVMCASAEKLKSAFHRARAEPTVMGTMNETEDLSATWAKLNMRDFESLPEYDTLKELIGERLDADAIEHDFYRDKDGRDWLLFKVQDAAEVSEAFRDLEERTDRARDEMPLEQRAQSAREASKAINAEREREKSLDIDRFEVRSK
jgi:hypothetical protein